MHTLLAVDSFYTVARMSTPGKGEAPEPERWVYPL